MAITKKDFNKELDWKIQSTKDQIKSNLKWVRSRLEDLELKLDNDRGSSSMSKFGNNPIQVDQLIDQLYELEKLQELFAKVE